ncbi:MAG: hypothetical protein U0930_21945 [Pirellulales bacterium]
MLSKKATGGWFTSFLLFVRRSHLYLGLLLCPWALLYGMTAYLFNHPSHFSDSNLRAFSSDVLEQAGFNGVKSPDELASRVIDGLNERFPDSKLTLNHQHPVRFVGDYFFASARTDTKLVQMLIFRNGSGGSVREQIEQMKDDKPAAPFAISGKSKPTSTTDSQANIDALSQPLKLDAGIDKVVEKALPEIARQIGYSEIATTLKLTSVPALEFVANSHETDWKVRYDSLNGTVSASLMDASAASHEFGWRRYLLRMHTTHGYPGEVSPRFYWAIVVDTMAAVMIFWGLSGIVMWWQLKRLRFWGGVAIASSLALATWLFASMAIVAT